MPYLDGAIVKTVARHKTPMARHDGVCNHIAVSNGASLFNYFNQPGNPTSHFYVRKGSAKPGASMADFEQYVDTRFEAPANLEGNHRLISIETQGGVGDDLDNGWNPLQIERLAWILAQCHQLHGIPLIAMPNSLPSTRGLGYHRLGVDPWRVAGGEKWSRSYGKVCPGTARMAQQGSIIARARTIAGTPSPETDMPLTNADADLVISRLLARKVPVGEQEKTVLACLSEASSANDAFVAVRNLAAKPLDVNALAAAIVAALPAGQPVSQATVEAGVRAVLGKLDE